MDWTNQTKFKNIMIAALLIINIITISALWMQVFRKNEEPVSPPPAVKNSGAVVMMERELGLNPEQTKQMEKIHADKVQALRDCNDSLDMLKKQFTDLIAQPNADAGQVNRLIEQIGTTQAKTEMLRLQLFSQLNSICTPSQKQKLHPILTDLFVKKNTKPDSEKPKKAAVTQPPTNEPAPPDQRPRPSIDEKVQKYARRLGLTDDQSKKVSEILSRNEEKRDALRNIPHPDRNMIESEKAKIRQSEDESIMQILSGDQKNEFRKMIEKRNSVNKDSNR
jgi:Spy/CpxP family protein refolding chaperone